MVILYGIKNCDTVKKARKWLDEHHIEYRFHDFRSDGLDEKVLRQWTKELGWEILLNKRGTTWRQLPESVKNNLDANSAIQIMLAHPSIIKRPVLDLGPQRKVGFEATNYHGYFSL